MSTWNDPGDVARRVGMVALANRLAHGWYPSIQNPDGNSIQGYIHDRHVLSIVRTLETTCTEAADEIDRLKARVAELEKPRNTWMEFTPEEPTYGPPHPGACVDGMISHIWTLTIEEGRVSLVSGCKLCDFGMDEYVPLEMWSGEFPVKIDFITQHEYSGEADTYMEIEPDTNKEKT